MRKTIILFILLSCQACFNKNNDIKDSYEVFAQYNMDEDFFVKSLPPVLVKSILKRDTHIDAWFLEFLDCTKQIKVLKSLGNLSEDKVENIGLEFEHFCKNLDYDQVFYFKDKIGHINGYHKFWNEKLSELIFINVEEKEVFVMSLKGDFKENDIKKLGSGVDVTFFRSLIDIFFE